MFKRSKIQELDSLQSKVKILLDANVEKQHQLQLGLEKQHQQLIELDKFAAELDASKSIVQLLQEKERNKGKVKSFEPWFCFWLYFLFDFYFHSIDFLFVPFFIY